MELEVIAILMAAINMVLLLTIVHGIIRIFKLMPPNKEIPPILEAGKHSPHFSFPTPTGTEIAEPSETDNPLLLVFVSTECEACEKVLPAVAAIDMEARNADYGLRTLVVVLDGADLHSAASFAKQFDYKGLVTVGEEQGRATARQFGITKTPSYIYLEPGGMVSVSGIVGDTQWMRFEVATGSSKELQRQQS